MFITLVKSRRDVLTTGTEKRGLDEAIHHIIEQQNAQAVISKPVSAEHQQHKAAILAQYADISDGELYP